MNAKLARRLFFACLVKTVEPGGDLYVFQANSLKIPHELCLRQSAGDSTGPQVDVAVSILGQRNIQRDIAELQTPSRFQNAKNFGKREFLLGYQI